jgi:hypothetical protein
MSKESDKDKPTTTGSGDDSKAGTPARRRGGAMASIQARAAEAEEKYQRRLKAWADEIREAPNEALRCSLFSPRNKNQPRLNLSKHELASYGTSRVVYTGEELRQDDLDVWLQVLHIARQKPLGEPIRFNPNDMKNTLQWGWGKEKTERLKANLTRLKANAVEFQSVRLGKGVVMSLIRRFEYSENMKDKRTPEDWVIELEPEIAILFGGGVYSTRLEWEQRMSISGNLAKWLHGFYSSHKEPHPLSTELLLATAGSKVKDKYKAREMLQSAHEELIKVGFLKSYEMNKEGKFTVERIHSSNQNPE